MTERLSNDSALEGPIHRLEALGLARPPQMTLRRYMSWLVERGVLPHDVATAFVDVVEVTDYGREELPEGQEERVRDALHRALDGAALDADSVQILADELLPPTSQEVIPHGGREPVSPWDEDVFETQNEPAEAEKQQPATPSPRPSRRPAVLIATVALWSAVMVTLGFWGQDVISNGIDEIKYRFLGGVRLGDVDRQLDTLRKSAADAPDSIAAWQSYANFARATERWADAIIALRHMVARQPGNPQLLNELAWLLCTADEPWARDPIQALELAERAFALDPAPHITDTLAEAAYQNGDPQRAVALELDAIRRLDGEDAFYRRQLEKFKAAAKSD